mgnify:CR=1 FL=1
MKRLLSIILPVTWLLLIGITVYAYSVKSDLNLSRAYYSHLYYQFSLSPSTQRFLDSIISCDDLGCGTDNSSL